VTILVVSFSLLFKSCISFGIRVVYNIEKERSSRSFGGSTFVKHKKSKFSVLNKGKHRFIPPPLGFLLYNYHYYLVACAFTLQEFVETLECITTLFRSL
jgi:hypothetical protein